MRAELVSRLVRRWGVRFSVMGRRKKCDDDDGWVERGMGWDVLRYWLSFCFCLAGVRWIPAFGPSLFRGCRRGLGIR